MNVEKIEEITFNNSLAIRELTVVVGTLTEDVSALVKNQEDKQDQESRILALEDNAVSVDKRFTILKPFTTIATYPRAAALACLGAYMFTISEFRSVIAAGLKLVGL